MMLFPITQILNTTVLYSQSSYGALGISSLIVSILVLACLLAAGISLILFSAPLGEIITPKTNGESDVKAISFEQAQALAFAVAGVLIFVETLPQLIPDIFTFLGFLFLRKPGDSLPGNQWPFNRPGIFATIGTLLKAALGLGLFFRAQGFANFWRSLRDFGTPKPPEN